MVGQGYGGSGGGICLYDGAQLNLSGGAISDNFAYNRGGGVSVGTSFASEHYAPRLTMTGGEISRSQAGSSGGGIYVQAGLATSEDGDWPTYGVATITAGTIADNTLTARGYGNDTFGGAGIYVNGYSSSYGDYHNGELYLTKVEVAGNEAGHEGGGYAACPTSVTKIELTNGSAFYDNSSDEDAAPEIFIMASRSLLAHSGNPVYEISPSLLGGGAYRWTFDDGAEVPLDKLQGTLSADDNETLSLDNPLTSGDAGVQTALGLATVHVTGNWSATRGGGIGSNGSVFIGTTTDTTEVPVSKVWNDAGGKDGIRPESVTVELYRDGEYVGCQTLAQGVDGSWSTTFQNLPKADVDGREYAYTVAERPVEGYMTTVTGNATDGYVIQNDVPTSVSGTKTWDDAGDQDGIRPDSITVDLLANGEKVGSQVVTAGIDGTWTFAFDNLPKYDENGAEVTYTVSEEPVEGYVATVDGYDITNAHTSEQPGTPTPTPAPGSGSEESTGPDADGYVGESSDETPRTRDSTPLFPICLIVVGAAAIAFSLSVRGRGSGKN